MLAFYKFFFFFSFFFLVSDLNPPTEWNIIRLLVLKIGTVGILRE